MWYLEVRSLEFFSSVINYLIEEIKLDSPVQKDIVCQNICRKWQNVFKIKFLDKVQKYEGYHIKTTGVNIDAEDLKKIQCKQNRQNEKLTFKT